MPDPSACPPRDQHTWPPDPCAEYNLRGPQVEPAASWRPRAASGRREIPSSATVAQAQGPQEGALATSSGADERAQARGPQEGAPVGGSDAAAIERARGPQKGAG